LKGEKERRKGKVKGKERRMIWPAVFLDQHKHESERYVEGEEGRTDCYYICGKGETIKEQK